MTAPITVVTVVDENTSNCDEQMLQKTGCGTSDKAELTARMSQATQQAHLNNELLLLAMLPVSAWEQGRPHGLAVDRRVSHRVS